MMRIPRGATPDDILEITTANLDDYVAYMRTLKSTIGDPSTITNAELANIIAATKGGPKLTTHRFLLKLRKDKAAAQVAGEKVVPIKKVVPVKVEPIAVVKPTPTVSQNTFLTEWEEAKTSLEDFAKLHTRKGESLSNYKPKELLTKFSDEKLLQYAKNFAKHGTPANDEIAVLLREVVARRRTEFSTYMRYAGSVDDEAYAKIKREIIESMCKFDKSISQSTRRMLIDNSVKGLNWVQFDLLVDMQRAGRKIKFVNTSDRAFFGSYTDKACHIFIKKESGTRVISHEFAHSVDDFFSGAKETGFQWKNGKYSTKAESKKLREAFTNQHSGTKGKYTNGDGYYWEDNWISNYEGRIYGHAGHGDEFWSMNMSRWSDYQTRLAKLEHESDLATWLTAGQRETMLRWNMDEALRGSDWGSARKKYRDLALYIEQKFPQGQRMMLDIVDEIPVTKVKPVLKVVPKKVKVTTKVDVSPAPKKYQIKGEPEVPNSVVKNVNAIPDHVKGLKAKQIDVDALELDALKQTRIDVRTLTDSQLDEVIKSSTGETKDIFSNLLHTRQERNLLNDVVREQLAGKVDVKAVNAELRKLYKHTDIKAGGHREADLISRSLEDFIRLRDGLVKRVGERFPKAHKLWPNQLVYPGAKKELAVVEKIIELRRSSTLWKSKLSEKDLLDLFYSSRKSVSAELRVGSYKATSASFFKELPKKLLDDIKEYTYGGDAKLNNALRFGKYKGTKSEIDMVVDSISNEILTRAPKFKGQVYRGMMLSKKGADDLLAKAKSGNTFVDNGFMSTSSNKSVGDDFVSVAYEHAKKGDVPILLEIESTTGVYVESITSVPHENEVLFNRGSSFIVKGFKKKVFKMREEIGGEIIDEVTGYVVELKQVVPKVRSVAKVQIKIGAAPGKILRQVDIDLEKVAKKASKELTAYKKEIKKVFKIDLDALRDGQIRALIRDTKGGPKLKMLKKFIRIRKAERIALQKLGKDVIVAKPVTKVAKKVVLIRKVAPIKKVPKKVVKGVDLKSKIKKLDSGNAHPSFLFHEFERDMFRRVYNNPTYNRLTTKLSKLQDDINATDNRKAIAKLEKEVTKIKKQLKPFTDLEDKLFDTEQELQAEFIKHTMKKYDNVVKKGKEVGYKQVGSASFVPLSKLSGNYLGKSDAVVAAKKLATKIEPIKDSYIPKSLASRDASTAFTSYYVHPERENLIRSALVKRFGAKKGDDAYVRYIEATNEFVSGPHTFGGQQYRKFVADTLNRDVSDEWTGAFTRVFPKKKDAMFEYAMEVDKALMSEYVKKQYGGAIKVYRGVGDTLLKKHPKLKSGDTIDLRVNALSSWTGSEDVAREFAINQYATRPGLGGKGVVLEYEVSADDVFFVSDLHAGFHSQYYGAHGVEFGIGSKNSTIKARVFGIFEDKDF